MPRHPLRRVSATFLAEALPINANGRVEDWRGVPKVRPSLLLPCTFLIEPDWESRWASVTLAGGPLLPSDITPETDMRPAGAVLNARPVGSLRAKRQYRADEALGMRPGRERCVRTV